ncbi:hypothetical protein LTR08_002849 [Meristemomyces frigidus]|nr:hypothetical protein LTR08_002849 [Meristemomyces frigidus]
MATARAELPAEETAVRTEPRLPLQCQHQDMDKRHIRLCTVEDGNKYDTIKCTLTRATFDESLDYKCLSYVWGSTNDKQTIVLDGEEHAVTVNLHAVLRRLRDAGMRSPIWIDALCINQQDDSDKQEQVAMMGEIFGSAQEVLVWLGEGPERPIARSQSDVAFDDYGNRVVVVHGTAPAGIEEVMSLLADNTHFHDLPFAAYCKSRRCPALSGGIAKGSHSWSEVLQTLRDWFDVAWFGRAWTVQEIVLARNATLILGAQTLPWDVVSRAWINLSRHIRSCCTECVYGLPGRDSEDLYRMAARILGLWTAKQKFEEGQHLIEPLLLFSWKSSTDPRDKLYGLLGLQSGKIPTPVLPDYTASLQKIFSCFAADTVTTQGWLVPLCLDLTQQLPDLPSWVPDWTKPRDDPVAYAVARFVWSFSYKTANGLTGAATVEEGFTLAVGGLHFDTIASMGREYVLGDDIADQLHILDAWKDMVKLNEHASSAYHAGGDLKQAFWRTMFADRFHADDKPRALIPNDIDRLNSFLDEMRVTLAEYGNDALIGQNEAMASHVIAVFDRRLFQTSNGWIGVCPKAAQVGDEVYILGGCPVPVILRAVSDHDLADQLYRTVGHCYVHGIMYGEAVSMDLPRVRVRII